MRSQVLFFLGLLAAAWIAVRLRALGDGRRLWRNARDTDFQGDGWRWTLCLLLPNLLLYRTTGRRDRLVPAGAPFTLDMVVLTRGQRMACYAEWSATQQWYAQQARRDQGGTR